ncbi:MAG TPA: hypothetical protein VFF06_09760 [Polyangia bacterium]|nr:hypothetical protein [Polyangia bacterium]
MIRAISALALLAAGCSGSGLAPGDGGGDGPPPNQVGGQASTLSIGPFDLAPGQEFTRCLVMPLGNTDELDAIQIDASLALGSHHLILYKTNATVPSTAPFDCSPFEGIFSSGDVPLFIAEKLETTLTLPSGVAYQFPAGTMLKLEAHYINASTSQRTGMGTVTLTPGKRDRSYLAADIMFCGSIGQLAHECVPPGVQNYTLKPGIYTGSGSVDLTQLKFFGFTSHEHRLGSDVVISRSTSSADPGTVLYENKSWDNPPLAVYDDAHLVQFGNNEGFRWQCSYDSADATPPPTGNTCFGESAFSNEMCFIWAYYFPSVGHFVSTECLF